MKSFFRVIIFGSFFGVSPNLFRNLTCGVDRSPVSMVYEGEADIETYPWLGILYYDTSTKRLSTAVILVTKQMVLGSANEIDKLPKEDIRSNSRVVLGQSCDGPSIGVREYSFHPDYRRNSHSALAMVQLEVDQVQQELRPICAPPTHFMEPTFYAMTPTNDCSKGVIRIYKMKYVNLERCTQFYRKSGLDSGLAWPSHAACARALSGGRCVWRSGTALVVKHDGRWRLLGFGLYGPGCQSPARFLDYGQYHQWVRSSVARIGQPAISRIAENHIVMRRTLSNVQRFGPCDPEETKYEMFTDTFRLTNNKALGVCSASYNVSLYHEIEYSCIVLKAEGRMGFPQHLEMENPRIHLRRWCAGPPMICHGFQFLEIHFFLEIKFLFDTQFFMGAYGKEAKILNPLRAMKYVNKDAPYPLVRTYSSIVRWLTNNQNKFPENKWFLKNNTENTNRLPGEDPDWGKKGAADLARQYYLSGDVNLDKRIMYWYNNQSLSKGGKDTGGKDIGGEDTGGKDTGGKDTGGKDTGGKD